MRLVVFLGAGFSRAFGLPVMREFFDYAHDADFLSMEDKSFLDQLRRDARSASSMIHGEHANLEHILSLTLMTAFEDNSMDTSHYNRICRVLGEIYRRIDTEPLDELSIRFRELVVGNELGSNSLTIITTNYDVLADYAIRCFGAGSDILFDWKPSNPNRPSNSSLYPNPKNQVAICKLHGSLNWFVSKSDPATVVVSDEILTGRVRGKDNLMRNRVMPAICAPNYDHGLGSPIIVPPTFSKTQLPEFMIRIWARARDAIMHADKICIIGYSFPDSDTHMRYFLAGALVNNINLRSLDIIDPNASNIVARIRESNSGYGEHFKDLLVAINSPWAGSGYSMLSSD